MPSRFQSMGTTGRNRPFDGAPPPHPHAAGRPAVSPGNRAPCLHAGSTAAARGLRGGHEPQLLGHSTCLRALADPEQRPPVARSPIPWDDLVQLCSWAVTHHCGRAFRHACYTSKTAPPGCQGPGVAGLRCHASRSRAAASHNSNWSGHSVAHSAPQARRGSSWLALWREAWRSKGFRPLIRPQAPSSSPCSFCAGTDAIALCICAAWDTREDGPHTLNTLVMRRAHLPLAMGGLGLRSAVDGRYAAYWASWADTLPTLQARHPHAVADIGLSFNGAIVPLAQQAPSTVALAEAASHLQCRGFTTPPWEILVGGGRPPPGVTSGLRWAASHHRPAHSSRIPHP